MLALARPVWRWARQIRLTRQILANKAILAAEATDATEADKADVTNKLNGAFDGKVAKADEADLVD
jgi:hypothetical protein